MMTNHRTIANTLSCLILLLRFSSFALRSKEDNVSHARLWSLETDAS